MTQEVDPETLEEPEPNIEVKLDSGVSITLTRNEEGIEICSQEACLVLPSMTASEFLAWGEFLNSLNGAKADA